MAKELFISTTPHETKVAVVEDEQLSEIYFERENEYTLAGSIYKGRVTRVLPGMQSAFVDIGLERDAFLYVSDFLEEQEDQEEFDRIPLQSPREESSPHIREAQSQDRVLITDEEAVQHRPESSEVDAGTRAANDAEPRRWGGRRSRRRGREGFPESKFVSQEPSDAKQGIEYERVVLPGESLAKYGKGGEESEVTEPAPERETRSSAAAP